MKCVAYDHLKLKGKLHFHDGTVMMDLDQEPIFLWDSRVGFFIVFP